MESDFTDGIWLTHDIMVTGNSEFERLNMNLLVIGTTGKHDSRFRQPSLAPIYQLKAFCVSFC